MLIEYIRLECQNGMNVTPISKSCYANTSSGKYRKKLKAYLSKKSTKVSRYK